MIADANACGFVENAGGDLVSPGPTLQIMLLSCRAVGKVIAPPLGNGVHLI
jgi:hypothetical protein